MEVFLAGYIASVVTCKITIGPGGTIRVHGNGQSQRWHQTCLGEHADGAFLPVVKLRRTAQEDGHDAVPARDVSHLATIAVDQHDKHLHLRTCDPLEVTVEGETDNVTYASPRRPVLARLRRLARRAGIPGAHTAPNSPPACSLRDTPAAAR